MADAIYNAPEVGEAVPASAAEPSIPVTANGEATEVPKQDEATASTQATTEVKPADGQGAAETAQPPPAPAADGDVDTTPASGKKEKRKSVGGVPEHKNKKLNKKKSMPTLHLDCKPGDYYWARLKGYPPWPSIICDEQMLPESLLANRPVSTTRPDGSLREDFRVGGKNARERTFPVMFLSTNEFQWMVNTSLTPLDPAECENAPPAKMTKALKDAYAVAAQKHDLDYFKGLLKAWQEETALIEKEMREIEEQEALEREKKLAEAEAAKQAEAEGKPKKAKARKSKGGDGDVEMEDADAPKSSKKRKTEGDAEGAKPKKTPKVTKLNAPKTPNGDAATPKKASTKAKKKVVQAPVEEDETPQMTEAERLQQREKAVLYLRHRLQKGFLTRDTPPKEAEMATMAEFFNQLESYDNLEQSVIRTTKIHKVLKGIVKLDTIPDGDQYNFKKRSAALLETWNKRMEAEVESAPASAVEAPKASTSTVVVADSAATTNGEKAVETTPAVEAAVADADADVKMKEVEETKEGAHKDVMEGAVEAKAEAAADQLNETAGPIVEEKVETVTAPSEAAVEAGTKVEALDGDASTLQPTVEEVPEAAS